MMAEVANGLDTLSASKNLRHILPPESPESDLLSPGVKEGMEDPDPVTRHHHEEHTFGEDPLIEPDLLKKVTALPSDSSTSSATGVSMLIENIPATVEPIPADSNKSPRHLFTLPESTDSPPITPSHQSDTADNDLHRKSEESKRVGKLRISKADLEIISSGETIQEEARISKKISSFDFPCKDYFISDGVTFSKDKKKHKKKKKKSSSERKNDYLFQNVNSEDEFVESKNSQKDIILSSKGGSQSNLLDYQEVFHQLMQDASIKHLAPGDSQQSSSLTPQANPGFDKNLHLLDIPSKQMENGSDNNLHGLDIPSNQKENGSDKNLHVLDVPSNLKENGPLPKIGFNGDSAIAFEDFSNISTSSSKENELTKRKPSGQKLPPTKRSHYNVVSQKNKIKNTFLPCYIVLTKVDKDLTECRGSAPCQLIDSVLPLSTRVNHLLDMCTSGSIICKKSKRKGVIIVEEPMYKNIFEETVLLDEADLESFQVKRSLRKRDKHISYVEPSEDDILDEFSRKRSRSKNKDLALSGDDVPEHKKKKKTDQCENKSAPGQETNATSLAFPSLDTSAPKKYPDLESVVDKSFRQDGKKVIEVIVYPKAPIPNKKAPENVAQSAGVEKKSAKSKSRRSDPNSHTPPATSSSHISILPSLTRQAPMPATPLFPPFPGALPPVGSHPVPAGTSQPITVPSPGLQKPQYCVMKVDGKDVLLQLVPSRAVNTIPAHSGNPVLLPGTKKLLMQNPIPLSSIVSQTARCSAPLQSLSGPVMAPAAHCNVTSAAFQPLFGLPLVSRNATPQSLSLATGQQNISLSSLPVISVSQLAGLTSTTGIRPVVFTTSGLMATGPGYTASAPGTTSAVRLTSSLTTALSSTITPMAAPNSTTVVRSVPIRPNLRAIVPNQASSSLRSIRIFVPGCTTTGTPGRFATLGSVANSSPLTRLTASSDLLPQRKHSADQDLTAEQRAAKRRKLEKKYPLPPGVVIKTEPVDSVPSPSLPSGGRSLLPQNILVSSVRPGMQGIRIIAPSLANALSTRPAGSNIIYKAATGGRQGILVPSSFGQLSTKTLTFLATPSVTVSSAVTSTTVSTSVATTTITSTTSSSTLSVAPPAEASSASDTDLALEPVTPDNSSNPRTSDTSLSDEGGALPVSSTISTIPLETCSDAAMIDELRMGVENMRKFIKTQISLGLKGERLDKLKELLIKKEEYYTSIKKHSETMCRTLTSEPASTSAASMGDQSMEDSEDLVGTETDPFVID
ncbi:uncharacterized protein LOC131948700 [Physella acuta]|uniref:uncharacterized protein LOC131948700 n=1 Tax=Physella acuta TaxID=109671 RepID=UPI0027DE3E89|nr:uncharacterized protein LOC131948700 [Physella acuta]